MDKKAHYFFALRLPDDTKKALHELCLSMEELFPFQRWVHEEDFHITLAFLGFAEKNKLENAVLLVERALHRKEGFPLSIDKLSFFGQESSPRILWGNTIEEERLQSLRKLVYDACVEVGFDLDKRPFKPHITLARKWATEHPFNMKELETFTRGHFPISFSAKEIVLYETNMEQLPKYESKVVYPLH